jgi:glutathione S-transferase
MFLPFLERMVSSMIYFKGLQIRDNSTFPSICRWFRAMESLPAVRLTKSDHYTHCWDLPPQLGGCGMEPEGEPFAQAIDGERDLRDASKSSWSIPTTTDDLGGAELDWTWISPSSARRECAERFLHNHGPVSRFATRGGGKGGKINKGFPPASAPLADPNASHEENLVPLVDALLGALCYRLLDDGHSSSKADEIVAKASAAAKASDLTLELSSSLAYLRDRVGVPRDMSLPAARWARGGLNDIISQLQ